MAREGTGELSVNFAGPQKAREGERKDLQPGRVDRSHKNQTMGSLTN